MIYWKYFLWHFFWGVEVWFLWYKKMGNTAQIQWVVLRPLWSLRLNLLLRYVNGHFSLHFYNHCNKAGWETDSWKSRDFSSTFIISQSVFQHLHFPLFLHLPASSYWAPFFVQSLPLCLLFSIKMMRSQFKADWYSAGKCDGISVITVTVAFFEANLASLWKTESVFLYLPVFFSYR